MKERFRERIDRKLAIIFIAHLSWLVTLALLVSWWGHLVLRQAERISTLEGALGLEQHQSENYWHHLQRMLFWESGTFFVLLIVSSGVLFWLYVRDHFRSRGIQAFFASVTHELRTPLTSIRLQAESIAEDLEKHQEQNAHSMTLLKRLLEDCMRLESQVDRTLELARVEGGGPVFAQDLQFKPWLNRFIQLKSQDYLDQIQIKNEVEDLWIQADPSALQVIVKNLLENSMKHSKRDRVRVVLSTALEGDFVVLEMKDDGEGFSGEIGSLGKLFQKGPASSGTGVGLYLVQVLMRRMGGKAQFLPPLDLTRNLTEGSAGFRVKLYFPKGLEGKGHD